MTPRQAKILVAGEAAQGAALVLGAPISFWGGVDPRSGLIADVRHPEIGQSVTGRVLFLPGAIGSSSASAVLLELVRSALSPAALVLDQADAVLLLVLIVAREMGWRTPPAISLPVAEHRNYRGLTVAVSTEGTLSTSVGAL
jgi:predicted aconitase with swiveling domain